MKKRYFIASPIYEHDILWKVCSTTSKRAFLEVYQADNYKEEKDFCDEAEAIHYVKSKGHKITKRNII